MRLTPGWDLRDVNIIIPARNEMDNSGAFLASLPPMVELVVIVAGNDGTDQLIMQMRPERTTLIRSDARIALARQPGAQVARGFCKTPPSLRRTMLLHVNCYVPMPRRWRCHDWGYWSIRNARRSDLRDVSP